MLPPAAAPPLSFGHAALAGRLVDELSASLEPGAGSSTEPALVIGVFGEWGAGKSRLLQAVAEALPTGDGKQLLNVIVPFNAWRYEREEHLLVPLLRVAQQCLRKALDDSVDEPTRRSEKLSDRVLLLGELAQTVYQHGGRELLQTALATQGVVLKLPELKSEAGQAKPSVWRRWSEHGKALKRARRLDLPGDQLHSLYYDFLEHLKAVTGRNPSALALHRERLKYGGSGWWPRTQYWFRTKRAWVMTGESPQEADFRLNLVFLVDDLDRCLPDKAVEVLEAVKLFLEVEGCAFVLALDEEVVERGIAHRYRDYALQGKEGMTPITGAEYLEKLVHLPVRLPRPTRAEAEDFLAFRHAELFAIDGRPNELARLVAAITPSVPRKLHRMINLLEMADQLASTVGGNGAERRHWLAIVCALQLFTPALYRYVRLRGPTLLMTLADWRADARLRDLDALREQLASEVRAVASPAELNYRLVLLRLPDLCAAALQNRSGFDLLELLAQVGELRQKAPLTSTQLGALLAFTEAKAEDKAPEPVEMPPEVGVVVTPIAPPQPPVVAMPAATEPLVAPAVTLPAQPSFVAEPAAASPTATSTSPAAAEVRLEDERGLLEALVSGNLELVRFALSKEGEVLRGRSLPVGFWELLRSSPWFARIGDWMEEGMPPGAVEQVLRELRPHLSQAMAIELLRAFGAPLHAVLRRPSWASRVRVEKEDSLSPYVLAPMLDRDLRVSLATRDVAAAAAWQVPSGWQASIEEISSQRVEDYKVVLRAGAEPRFGVFALLTITRDSGSHPVTQRLRWMEPGSFLSGSPSDEAGRMSDEPLPAPASLHTGFWMADTACTRVLWWTLMPEQMPPSRNGDDDNEPVRGVAPEQVFEFLRRLARLLPPCRVQLPSAVEWEYACRAGTITPWAFGVSVNAGQVRMLSAGPAPVASLPPNPWGLYEMHGNVAEICADWPSLEGRDGSSAEALSLRGGSFADPPAAMRSASMRGVGRQEIRNDVGFRFTLRAWERGEAAAASLPDPAF